MYCCFFTPSPFFVDTPTFLQRKFFFYLYLLVWLLRYIYMFVQSLAQIRSIEETVWSSMSNGFEFWHFSGWYTIHFVSCDSIIRLIFDVFWFWLNVNSSSSFGPSKFSSMEIVWLSLDCAFTISMKNIKFSMQINISELFDLINENCSIDFPFSREMLFIKHFENESSVFDRIIFCCNETECVCVYNLNYWYEIQFRIFSQIKWKEYIRRKWYCRWSNNTFVSALTNTNFRIKTSTNIFWIFSILFIKISIPFNCK